jgi:hypothetical protein
VDNREPPNGWGRFDVAAPGIRSQKRLWQRNGRPTGQRTACGASPTTAPRRRDRSRAHIAPRKPQQNGFVESFNGRLRDELLKNESPG